MKTTFLTILLVFSIFIYSQEKNSINDKFESPQGKLQKEWVEEKDIEEFQGKKFIGSLEIYVPNADEKLVPIKLGFMCETNVFAELEMSAKKINRIHIKANFETMKRIKNIYTYTPKRIDITYNQENKGWFVNVIYAAQNDYGALKNGTSLLIFDNDGNFVKSMF
jgi:hypothetical protein